MQATEAARYLGISTSKLSTLTIPRRVSGGNRLFDRQDLDNFADQLNYEGEQECQSISEIDAAFGLIPPKVA